MTLDQHLTPTSDICSNCAMPLNEHARFCPSCGEPRAVAETAPAEATSTERLPDADATTANPTFEHVFTPATVTDLDALATDARHQR